MGGHGVEREMSDSAYSILKQMSGQAYGERVRYGVARADVSPKIPRGMNKAEHVMLARVHCRKQARTGSGPGFPLRCAKTAG